MIRSKKGEQASGFQQFGAGTFRQPRWKILQRSWPCAFSESLVCVINSINTQEERHRFIILYNSDLIQNPVQ